MKKAWQWFVSRVKKEKAAVVGTAVTAAWWINDGIVDGDWTDWRVLVPFGTSLIIRIFVTSEDVSPGWRRS